MASTSDGLVESFQALVNALGMGCFCLFEISSVGTEWEDQLVIGTFPLAFLDRFWRERRTFDSAYIRHARLSGMPFKADAVLGNPNLSRIERRGVEKAKREGMENGIVFPLSGRMNRIAFLAIVGDPDILNTGQIRMLTYLSVHFYQRACVLAPQGGKMPRYSDPGVLTGRERECLTLVGMGKTDPQISESLGVSKRTVRYHIENAMEKLGASTRLQAVITALRNVEIMH